MQEAPRSFNNSEAVIHNFSVHEARNEGSEMNPVLYFERNGDRLKVTLDLPGNTFEIQVLDFKDESSDADKNRVYQEIATIADTELDKRRQALGDLFA